MIVDYTHCIHCGKYLKQCNPEHLIETVYDGKYIEQRYVCEKCYIRFYKFKGEE